MSIIDLGPASSELDWAAIGIDAKIIKVEEIPGLPRDRAALEQARVNLGANKRAYCLGYGDPGQEEGLTLGDVAIALVTPKQT